MSANPVLPAKPDHPITVQLVDGHALPGIPAKMTVGQTVSYSSPAGKVTITFEQGSPFDEPGHQITVVSDSTILQLKKAGDFFCKCFITLPTTPLQIVGWHDGEDPQSGGDHHVGH